MQLLLHVRCVASFFSVNQQAKQQFGIRVDFIVSRQTSFPMISYWRRFSIRYGWKNIFISVGIYFEPSMHYVFCNQPCNLTIALAWVLPWLKPIVFDKDMFNTGVKNIGKFFVADMNTLHCIRAELAIFSIELNLHELNIEMIIGVSSRNLNNHTDLDRNSNIFLTYVNMIMLLRNVTI